MIDYQISSIVLPCIVKTALNHGVDIQSIFQRLDVKIDLANIEQSTIRVELLIQIVELMSQKPQNGLMKIIRPEVTASNIRFPRTSPPDPANSFRALSYKT